MSPLCRVALPWMAACVLAAPAFAFSPAPDVTPDEWAGIALAGCRAAADRTREADNALAQRFASGPASREQTTFLTREATARATADGNARRAALARLNVLLFSANATFPIAGSRETDSFRNVLNGLLGRESVCAIEAIEATVVFGTFGVPFTADLVGQLRPDREFEVIEARSRERLNQGNSVEQVFERMRPGTPDDLGRYVGAVAREALSARQDSANHGAIAPETDRRLRQFLEFISYAEEPVRVRSYLHAKVDVIEGALGVTLPESADKALFRLAQAALYSSVDRMRRLRELTPGGVLQALEPVVDRWFRTSAVPGIRRTLAGDPFAAYWFYVQSGGIAAPGPVFSGSRVTILQPAFSLAELGRLPMTKALERLRTARVPASFQQHHLELESAFTERTFSREDVLARLEQTNAASRTAAGIRQFILADERSSRVSSLDFYSPLIRDANRIRGRVDRQFVSAAIDVIGSLKADRVNEDIQRILDADTTSDPRLAGYLHTTAALMLELERRQAAESSFRQGTSGAAVGWLLSRFFIGGNVPVELWAPQGVTGPEFAELVNELTPKNRKSGNDYRGRPVSDISVAHDGQEYHEALVTVIDSARQFLNISSFDWKTDMGGRDIAYRLMAKKLGIDGPEYSRFLVRFEGGLPMDPLHPAIVAFYDIPTTRMKDLLTWYFFVSSNQADVVRARDAARAAGATLECATVRTCGDLDALLRQTGTRYDPRRRSPAYDQAWQAYQQIDALFDDRRPALEDVRPRRALREYCEDADALRRLVRRAGLRRADRADEPFPINIVADAKQNLFNIRMGEHSEVFPHVFMEPIRDIYFMLIEFDIRIVLWKGPMELPWHIGPVPIPGRKILGRIPMPFVPWPWLSVVPGFGWAGPVTSVFLQYLLASDVRIWWATVNHTKSWSNESVALESGMGMASKYFDQYDTHKTWHDTGVVVRGAPVDDVNDHFV